VAEYGRRGVSSRTVCAVLGAPRSRLYPRRGRQESVPVRGADRDKPLSDAMRAVCERHLTYGYRRVTAVLHREGVRVNHKRVNRIMREAGLTRPRIRTQRVGADGRGAAGDAEGPDRVWQMDLTRVWVEALGWVNVVAIIDVWDRSIVGHVIAARARSAEWVAALDRAAMARFPAGIREGGARLRLQVDNGCQPCSRAFVAATRALGIELFYTHVQAPKQNAYIERFFRTLKEEEVWPNIYNTLAEAQRSIDAFITFYNEQRVHSALGYQPPACYARTQPLAA